MLSSAFKRRRLKKGVWSSGPHVRTFSDPALQIFHELRVEGTKLDLSPIPPSLQSSPQSRKKPQQGARRDTVPSSARDNSSFSRSPKYGSSETCNADSLNKELKFTSFKSPEISSFQSLLADDEATHGVPGTAASEPNLSYSGMQTSSRSEIINGSFQNRDKHTTEARIENRIPSPKAKLVKVRPPEVKPQQRQQTQLQHQEPQPQLQQSSDDYEQELERQLEQLPKQLKQKKYKKQLEQSHVQQRQRDRSQEEEVQEVVQAEDKQPPQQKQQGREQQQKEHEQQHDLEQQQRKPIQQRKEHDWQQKEHEQQHDLEQQHKEPMQQKKEDEQEQKEHDWQQKEPRQHEKEREQQQRKKHDDKQEVDKQQQVHKQQRKEHEQQIKEQEHKQVHEQQQHVSKKRRKEDEQKQQVNEEQRKEHEQQQRVNEQKRKEHEEQLQIMKQQGQLTEQREQQNIDLVAATSTNVESEDQMRYEATPSVANNNEASAPIKPQTISRGNTQSAARLHHPVSSEGPNKQGQQGPKMDLVYITERIISLAFPPGLDDADYTVHLRDVAHMLSSKHGDSFRIFDLALGGEVARFLPRVTPLGWANGLAPPLERLCSVCKSLDSWLNQNPSHVAVLHSRSGYEKLGVVLAAYMHYSNICASTDQALDRYAMKRFFDDKIGQLYHPSQKRYVQYFAGLLSGVIRINSNPLYLHTLTLYGVPHFDPRGGCHLFIKIYQGMTPVYTSGVYNLTEAMRQVTIAFEMGVQLRGDILLKAYHRRLAPASREVIFRVQFHTCAVSDRVLPFARQQLDDACNDLRFPLDGGIELLFSQAPDDRPRIVSNVSCDKAPCAITAWDSYENIASQEQGVGSDSVSHTFGPLDGSLYATVTKRRSISSAAPHSPTAPSPSPHGANGRYAASIDSGIASSNSAGAAPISPPTSDTSRASGDTGGTAPVAAPTPRPGSSGVAGKSAHVDARQLDELLAGMLLDIQSIPDLRPCQTPAPDIDSIRCPDFSGGSLKTRSGFRKESPRRADIPPPKQYGGSTSPVSPLNNGYSGSSQNSFFSGSEDVPYHARTDSKPFSYGAVTSSPLLHRHRSTSEGASYEGGPQPPPSPSIHRKNSRETLGTARVGLESPRLVRRMSGSVGASPGDGHRHSRSPSPSPEPGSRGGTLKRERSQTVTTRIMAGDTSPSDTLGRSTLTRSTSRLEDTVDGSYGYDSFNRSYSSGGSVNSSWLQMQQRKLQERRDAKTRAEKGPQEAKMFSELRSRIMQHQHAGRDFEDGYISDTTLLSETSRESSPMKAMMTPLTINTSASTPQKPPIGHSTPSKGNSAPSSPTLPHRSVSLSTSTTTRQYSNTLKGVSRKHSDASNDRERPFMAVKRAHENSRGIDTMDSNTAFSQLQTSPLGHINYSMYNNASATSSGQPDGLLTTTTAHTTAATQDGIDSLEALSTTLASISAPGEPQFSPTSDFSPTPTCTARSLHSYKSGDEMAWQSDTDTLGTNRPITPAFPPATPTTPYLNQGLPPKSPTAIRRALLGMSPIPTRSELQRTVSLPSKEVGTLRSPSPATNQYSRQEMNGHSSPAPSLYHGQSRRSSLTSLNESIEVISSHPKFVKDISKFWYKPNISRDDAINMLREKPPGTFIVRDSNSFPGAFGLALKVSTPPPNVTSKSSDPTSELVRHFLIEPTSRGVRLKGCANEPVFGSLSALVYQHSITALALPCRLSLPDKDPAGSQDSTDGTGSTLGNKADTAQLLHQGAACSVLFLYSADTESLTGPQAVKRAIQLMLASKPTPTVVHFKVSSQGITLTDSSRQLFFRRHYPVSTVSHCGLDPDDRRWAQKNEEGEPVGSLRMFGFVAKKGASRTDNQCHIFAELEPEQPATAICNFITKVMMTSINRANLV